MWSLDAPPAGAGSPDRGPADLLGGQERSLRSVLHLVQALAGSARGSGGLWLVTRGSQAVTGAPGSGQADIRVAVLLPAGPAG